MFPHTTDQFDDTSGHTDHMIGKRVKKPETQVYSTSFKI